MAEKKKKRGGFSSGDILEINLGDNSFGYCKVLKVDNFAPIFQIYSEILGHSIGLAEFMNLNWTRKSVVYINSAAVKREWYFIGNVEVTSAELCWQPFFFGTSSSVWTVEFSDGSRQRISPDESSYTRMLSEGYIHKISHLCPAVVSHVKDDRKMAWKGSPL